MPLTSFSSDEAFANVRAERASRWPDGRRDRERLGGIANVSFRRGFALTPGERVFTVGSCFARNIEQRLFELGFDVPACAFSLPAKERASETENDFLNKYPPHSILNEFQWALDPDVVYPEDGLLEIRSGLWHDPHSAPNLKPASLARVRERRAMVADFYRQIPDCRIIVMTLGLVEAWFDNVSGYYLNGAPPAQAMQAQPGRFRLDVLSPDEIHQALVDIHQLLSRFGHPDFRMLLTVSPVPMRTTFTGQDAITANSYSKSALRAAAEMFVLGRANVDYFPSYEIVTLTNRAAAYIQDNRHVTPQLVNTIVDRVIEAYCPDLLKERGDQDRMGPRSTAREIRKALKLGDLQRAVEMFASLEAGERYRRAGFDELNYRYDFGRTLLKAGAAAEAQLQLALVVKIAPDFAAGCYQLGRALARLQRPLDAEESFRRAVSLAPDSPEMRLAHANALSELGRHDEAESEVRLVLERHPGDPRTDTVAAAMRDRKGRSGGEAEAGASSRTVGAR